MAKIADAGIYDLSAEEYHADPCPTPSLSSSIARILLTQSPRHAWYSHPRFNGAYVPEESETFDLGTVAHAYLLQGEEGFAKLNYPDWRTKAAQLARETARAEGKIPILAHKWLNVRLMAQVAKRQLGTFADTPRPFENGRAEEVLVWREGETWCRARLDWLHADHVHVDDLKTTSGSAQPDVFGRSIFRDGYDIQAAFYLRGLRAVFGTEGMFRFVALENEAPFGLSVLALDPAALALADRKVRRALAIWQACVETNRWPTYPSQTCYVELPPWEEPRLMEQELRDEGIKDDGRPIGELL